MQVFWGLVILALLLALLTGLVAILSRNSTVEWVMAAQLLGTSGVGILLVLGVSLPLPVLVDVALVLVVLAVLVTAVFTRRQAQRGQHD